MLLTLRDTYSTRYLLYKRSIVPKQLVFSLAGAESSFAINKVDRSKLYGYKETEILDEDRAG